MPAVPSQRVELKPSHLAEFLKIAGTDEGGHQYITDTTEKGLSLRLKGQKISWMLRYKGNNWTLGWTWEGEAWHIPNIKSGRDLAAAVKHQYEYGGEPYVRDYLRLWHDNNKRPKADRLSHDQIVREMRPKTDSWTLRQCIDKAIADKTHPDAEDPWAVTYVRDIKTTFGKPEFADLLDQPVTNLRSVDIERIREIMLEKHGSPSPAQKVVRSVSTILSHTMGNYRELSGMNQVPLQWWLLIKVGRKTKNRKRRPDVEGLAKTLILADLYTTKRLPGRIVGTKDNKNGIRPPVAAAFHWVNLSCQRVTAALSLERASFYPDPVSKDGWYLAAWGEGVMKAGVAHVLPIPPRMVAHMRGLFAKVEEKESKWQFPSERGKEENDIHVSRSATLGVMERLGARDDIGRKRPDAVDLLSLNKIAWWTQHDVRRTLAAVLDNNGIPGGATVILAHEVKVSERLDENDLSFEDREEWMRQRVAKITRLAYGAPQHLKLKREAMSIWVDAVLDEYDRLKAEWTPRE